MSEPFDFEAFIAGTQLARRTVHFYKVDHADEIRALTEQHDAAAKVTGDRESSKAEHRKVAERIKVLRAEMEASRVDIVVRTLTPDEFKEIKEADDKDAYDQIALQSVEPQLSVEQCRRLASAIGFSQWNDLVSAATELVLSKVAVPDFSQSVSTTLNPSASSPS